MLMPPSNFALKMRPVLITIVCCMVVLVIVRFVARDDFLGNLVEGHA